MVKVRGQRGGTDVLWQVSWRGLKKCLDRDDLDFDRDVEADIELRGGFGIEIGQQGDLDIEPC